jgi:hypothetical protein
LAAKEGGGSATVQASVADLLKSLGLRVEGLRFGVEGLEFRV